MAHTSYRLAWGMLAAALLVGACTVKKQEAPALTGPSELSTAISIAVTPDVLTQDGASQSLVTITARDASGQPLRNLSLRVEIAVNGALTDFGTLSARNVVTDANGKASVTYTAPAAPAVSVDNGIVVSIHVTPSGTDFANATARTATIRLVPPGTVGSRNNLVASFTVSPPSPTDDSVVLFDATPSVAANPTSTLVSYAWTFGDGDSATGKQVTHAYKPGTYTATLTITDATNKTGTSRSVLAVSTVRPTAVAIFSPANPQVPNQPTHFDASGSTATAGHRIVSYTWNFGEGTVTTTASPRIDFTYQLPRTYNVLLTVTDEAGRTSTPIQLPVTVG